VRSSATYNASRTGVRLDPPARGRAGLPQPPAQAANPDATLNQPGTARRLQGRHKSKAIILGNLALAHIRQRDVGQAAAVLHRAIDLLEVSRGGGGLTWSPQPSASFAPGATSQLCKTCMNGSSP
jgi:hypothetical protein